MTISSANFEEPSSEVVDRSASFPRISVVINSDSRLEHLRRTIASLAFQTYANFEVCVVAGPTEDGTRAYLEDFELDLKIGHCAARNLSMSRNIGIALAAGDVVAFIDDDAIPESEWLEQLARSYDDERVGAVGGFVHDHLGLGFQAQYVTVDRLGIPRAEEAPTPFLNYPGSPRFPHLLGTNCCFRRSALLAVGGFDEQYEYFLDETDLCCRLNDAGFHIVQRPDAFVHHHYAPSHIRDPQRRLTRWYPILKNRIYYALRHGAPHYSPLSVLEYALEERNAWKVDLARQIDAGESEPSEMQRFEEETQRAIEDGMAASETVPTLLTSELLERLQSPFRPFVRRAGTASGAHVYLSGSLADCPSVDEGNFWSHAKEKARAGDQVHVILRQGEAPSVDWFDGIWIYDVGPGGNGDPGEAVFQDFLARITARRSIQCVLAPSGSAAKIRSAMGLQRNIRIDDV